MKTEEIRCDNCGKKLGALNGQEHKAQIAFRGAHIIRVATMDGKIIIRDPKMDEPGTDFCGPNCLLEFISKIAHMETPNTRDITGRWGSR